MLDRAELRSRIAQRFGTTLVKADRVIQAALGTIIEALRNRETVMLRGLGTFRVSDWKVGPVVKFKAAKSLKAAIRQKESQ